MNNKGMTMKKQNIFFRYLPTAEANAHMLKTVALISMLSKNT